MVAKKFINAKDIAQNTILKKKLFKKSNYLLLMVSGGSDSVALAYIINDIVSDKSKLAIMHLNHNLRNDAKDDEKFVEGLANHLNIRLFKYSKDVEKYAQDNKLNVEAAGHELRYKYANSTVEKWAADINAKTDKFLICTAHNADDRIENFYMRSIVGTGPGGFAGIAYKNDNIIHPLLDISKDMLNDYIRHIDNTYSDEFGNTWHEDSTNKDTDRFRAYVRHNIIPLAKRQNPQILNNLSNSMNLIADENEFIEKQVNNLSRKYISIVDDQFSISPDFQDEDLVLKRRAIYNALLEIFPKGTRIDTKSITSILEACETSNFTDNIQQNYSVHSNKHGVLVQPMSKYRKSRKRI